MNVLAGAKHNHTTRRWYHIHATTISRLHRRPSTWRKEASGGDTRDNVDENDNAVPILAVVKDNRVAQKAVTDKSATKTIKNLMRKVFAWVGKRYCRISFKNKSWTGDTTRPT
jgi:hypothetical protein